MFVSPFDNSYVHEISYAHFLTSQTWLPTPPDRNLRLQRHNGLIAAPTITP